MLFDGGFLKKLEYQSLISRRVFRAGAVFGAVALSAGSVARGDDKPASALRPANIEWRTRRIKVVDSITRQSIAGAVTRCHSLRVAGPMRVAEWSERSFGPFPRSVTDQDGMALVELPKYAEGCSGVAPQEIVSLVFNVDHPDYATDNYGLEFDRPGQPPKAAVGETELVVALYPGRKLKVGAYAENADEMLDNVFGVVSFPLSNVRWAKMPDGLFQSTGFYSGCRRCWVVHLPHQGTPLFSAPMSIPSKSDGDELLATVTPGVRVEGRVHESVPRPIKHGRVRACVRLPGDPSEPRPIFGELAWEEWAGIRDDGSFEFPSLPTFADLELIGYCDGYVSSPMSDDKFLVAAGKYEPGAELQGTNLPQLFRLGRETLRPVLTMQRSAAAVMSFVDGRGRPLSGVRVKVTFPIGGIGWSGDATFNRQRSTRDWLRNPLGEIDTFREKSGRFEAVSDSSGQTRLPDIPLYAGYAFIELPGYYVAAESVERLIGVQLQSGQTTQIEIVLKTATER